MQYKPKKEQIQERETKKSVRKDKENRETKQNRRERKKERKSVCGANRRRSN